MTALEALRPLAAVRVEGLMALPPYEADPSACAPIPAAARAARPRPRGRAARRLRSVHGMSHDLEVAVEEGATLVRVGTAIFGERAAAQGGAD